MTSYKSNVAHIVYASDDKFSEILGVSLVSLYENNKDFDDIVVCILDSGIKSKNKRKLLSICETYQRTRVTFYPVQNISEHLSMEVVVDRGSLSQYARLFLSSALPENQKRVLYLDCDTLINQSISELWNLDLNGKTIAALMEALSPFYRKNINLKSKDIMFNSGIMLIDLELWEKKEIEKKALKFIASKHGNIQQGDQGALNAILSEEVYCFSPTFNSITLFYDFTYKEIKIYRKPQEFYTEEEIRRALETPTLIHFTTSFLSKRPWIKGSKHVYRNKWLKYRDISPWKDTPLWEDYSSKWKMRGLAFYTRLPKVISVRIAGVAHAYGRPLINRVKGK